MAACSQIRINNAHTTLQRDSNHGLIRFTESYSLPPGRVGSLRRKPKGATRPQSGPREARSLDTYKYLLETSCSEWLKATETKRDKHRRNLYYQAILVSSVEKIVHGIEVALANLDELEPGSEVDRDKKRLRVKLKLWSSAHQRLANCQAEWIGYKATCCSTALAIPVGCNHRLCFLCNSRRVEKYRERVSRMLNRLTHPVLITLTVPNDVRITKRHFSKLRRNFNKFRKEQSWIQGGLYSLETTFNKSLSTPWHPHIHGLLDSAFALPGCECGICPHCKARWQTTERCTRCGSRMRWRFLRNILTGSIDQEHSAGCHFIRFKRGLEFAWLLCSGGRKAGWRPGSFAQWYSKTEPDYPWRSAGECSEWQSRNRRSIDIRRVTDRKKAAYEIVKYITKASAFADQPCAIAEFGEAVRGARCLQTFGTWYGVKLSESEDVNSGAPSEKNNWHALQCECGKRDFVRLGRLYRDQVFSDASGQWHIKPEFVFPGKQRCTGPPGNLGGLNPGGGR